LEFSDNQIHLDFEHGLGRLQNFVTVSSDYHCSCSAHIEVHGWKMEGHGSNKRGETYFSMYIHGESGTERKKNTHKNFIRCILLLVYYSTLMAP
jgi:hypothetical protein